MHCVVTAGPTYEPLDNVRRLTNFSTGKLGVTLAGHLTHAGHHVTLLLGDQATFKGPPEAARVEVFTTTQDLGAKLAALGKPQHRRSDLGTHPGADAGPVGAVFHAAAVNDFAFGKVWRRAPDVPGGLEEVSAGKIPTRPEGLLVELVAAPKLIASLRAWFPRAFLAGWKFEVDGTREDVVAKARAQMEGNGTDGCVVNGQAYGEGFGWVDRSGTVAHAATDTALFQRLTEVIARRTSAGSAPA